MEKEAEFLQKLSKLEGFLPYDGWQTVPIKRRRLGYEVYLVSPYKHSLAKYIRRNPEKGCRANPQFRYPTFPGPQEVFPWLCHVSSYL